MKSFKFIRIFIVSLLLFLTIGCDQASKVFIRGSLDYNEQIEFFGRHFIITKVENTGAFLSFGDSLPILIKVFIFMILPGIFIALGLLFAVLKKDIQNLKLAGLCLILGGGIGNVFDRIAFGSVTDFLHINFGFIKTGIFNLADFFVMVGAFMILLKSVPMPLGKFSVR